MQKKVFLENKHGDRFGPFVVDDDCVQIKVQGEKTFAYLYLPASDELGLKVIPYEEFCVTKELFEKVWESNIDKDCAWEKLKELIHEHT